MMTRTRPSSLFMGPEQRVLHNVAIKVDSLLSCSTVVGKSSATRSRRLTDPSLQKNRQRYL